MEDLKAHYESSFSKELGTAQQNAWADQLRTLHREFTTLVNNRPDALGWSIIFEYELPRERGRRPDVILLAGSEIIVLEFKGARTTTRAAVDQLEAYARDIREYHAASHEHSVRAMLVLSQGDDKPVEFEEIRIVFRQDLGAELGKIAADQHEPIELQDWLSAPYAPLPSLVAAARSIFEHEPLPSIRRAQSTGIGDALDALQRAAIDAQSQGERHLALVTGVPGAGKTLVGLQFVYATRSETQNQDAIFLSGNGPLIEVLQHALRGKDLAGRGDVFVRDVHGFLKEYGGDRKKTPHEHIWVYDEAQRAWDAERVLEKRKHQYSEPEDFIRLGDRMPGWSLIIGLVGEGQEIHLGEESGLGQWNDAITGSHEHWTVHCPPHLSGLFSNVATVEEDAALNLTESLRSHVADDVPNWISALLDGQLDRAHTLMQRIAAQGFDAYVSRDLGAAKEYLRERYADQSTYRYGLIASSKANNLEKYNVRNKNFGHYRWRGPWFNDPPNSVDSCCQLISVATEFDSQGLELDFPLICWGDDFWWEDGWRTKLSRRAKAKDPHQLRVNSYRVLLSRGRDGFLVWVPPEVALDPTFAALVQAGLRVLV
jgi:hypothetical protein